MQELFEKAQQLRDNGEIEQAISLYKHVRNKALANKNQKLATECLHMIGVAYYQSEQFNQARQHLQKAQTEFMQQKDYEGVGFVFRDRGLVALKENLLDEAEILLKTSIETLHNVANVGHEGISFVKLGNVLVKQGDTQEAIGKIKEGIKLLKESNEKFFLATAHFDLAKVWASMNKKELAIKNAKESLEILNSFSSEDQFQEKRKDIEKFLKDIFD